MPAPPLRLSLCALGIALLTGCGGALNTVQQPGSNPAGNTPTTITVTFQGALPTALATQIGAGSFTAVTPAASVAFTLPGGTSNFAIAYVCTFSVPPTSYAPSAYMFQNVIEATTADETTLAESCPGGSATSPAIGALTGSIDGSAIPGVTSYGISEGLNFTAANLGGFGSNFSIPELAGAQRVLASAYKTVFGSPSLGGGYTMLAAKNFDNQPVPGALNNGNTVVLGPADETTSQTISYNNIPSGFTGPLNGYSTVAQLVMNNSSNVYLATPATTQYPVLPAGATEPGDYYFVTAYASSSHETMILTQTSSTAIPISFTFPLTWGYSGPAPASLPTFNLAYTGIPTGGNASSSVGLQWLPTPSSSAAFYVAASFNYLGASRSVVFPDLTTLPGFSKPPSGATVFWNAEMKNIAYGTTPSSAANATTTSIADTGSYSVP